LDTAQSFIVFDVIDETLRVSNLVDIAVGSRVNVERSLKIGDEIGGHMLSGHVHTQAVVTSRVDSQDNCMLSFSLATEYQKYVFAKGFISINGISLTLGAEVGEFFSVHLIPETLSRTNLENIGIGEKVNIEFDQQTMTIVETIERMKLNLS
jgi:riboflavin synthase